MSPTIFRERGFRFFFFSREEKRRHVHVHRADGEAKYWLEPNIELARNYRLSALQLAKIRKISSSTHGISTSGIEVTNVSSHGIWLLADGREHFLSYDDFPWFKAAPIGKITNVNQVSWG